MPRLKISRWPHMLHRITYHSHQMIPGSDLYLQSFDYLTAAYFRLAYSLRVQGISVYHPHIYLTWRP